MMEKKSYMMNGIRFAWTIGLMVFFILCFLLPYGTGALTFKRGLILFGLCVLISTFCYLFNTGIKKVFPTFFQAENWRIWKTVFLFFLNFVLVAIINFFYSVLFLHQEMKINAFFEWFYITVLVGILPSLAAYFIERNYMMQQMVKEAKEMENTLREKKNRPKEEGVFILHLPTLPEKNADLDMQNIISLESCGNYIRINMLNEGKLAAKMIRTTMKQMEKDAANCPFVIKCHRAYMINLNYIENIEGNLQAYKLRMKYLKNEVPVSRSYYRILREKIEA